MRTMQILEYLVHFTSDPLEKREVRRVYVADG
jgi:hypothetical protein